MLGDAFITSLCTGHVAALSKVPACGCLLSHRPSDFAGECPLPPRSVSMHRVEASPCHLHWLARNIQMYVHVHHITLHWHVVAPNNVCACGCFLSHRLSDFAGERPPRSVSMHGVEASPCHLHWLGSKHSDDCLLRVR